MTFDLQTSLIAVGIGLAIVILLWLMLRARIGRQRLRRDAEGAQVERTADPYAVTKERPYMKAAAPPVDEPRLMAEPPAEPDEVAVAVAVAGSPLAGDMAGIAATSDVDAHGDDLTQLKGVGPKLAALLAEQGITQLSQLAALGEGDVTALDDRLGAFKGRLARDRVVEQARLLASGDRDGYEAAFGKLGG